MPGAGAGGDLPVGAEFGDYEIRGRLGAGGMGVVFRAYDRRHGGEVALKVLPAHLADDRVTVERFRREARAAFELRDPHVVPVHGFGETDGRLHLAMRLIDGEDLARLLARRAPLPPRRAAGILRQAAHALDAAHAAGMVHRDVKPANLLVVEARDDFTYLVDFGIARALGPDPDTALTETGATVGTLAYLAPERLQDSLGPVDGRADVYSLTCVLVEMLTGRPPFTAAEPAAVLSAHLLSPPPRVSARVPGLDPAWDDVVARGLAKRPDDRFSGAGELAAAVARVADREPRPTREQTRPAPALELPGGDRPDPGPRSRGLLLAIGAVAVTAAVLVGVVWAVLPGRGAGPGIAVPTLPPASTVAAPPTGSPTGGSPSTDGTATAGGGGTLQPAGGAPGATGPTFDPLVGDGDLGLAAPITRLACTGDDVVVVGAGVDPARYPQDVVEHLAKHPGARYLRSLGGCGSFRPRTPTGELIYVVYLGPFTDRGRACAALAAAGGDSYLQPLGAAPSVPGGPGC
ncbi:serine/threonine protein kinase [Pseudonocardia ammonioxydans]|uniref:non-specific serine/threonine protein kinase n=1 Tax=Pseudonocardia ammonioxydans TaxID=260086 RepID=A0A1I4T2S6_PSUAM|nr:serine/threonine-protein kinase [Pseudonocardia ammonioxydans]SFM70903.1 serine/threonine protein kinase [Pseudonocardia ammonioxydans]